MAWFRTIGGRIKSDFQYSIGIVYNTFPVPELTDAQKNKLDTLAKAVLEARAQFPDSILADLYDPTTMPSELRKAHNALDVYVDKLYDPKGFTDDRHRAEHLLARYEEMSGQIFDNQLSSRGPKKRAVKKANS